MCVLIRKKIKPCKGDGHSDIPHRTETQDYMSKKREKKRAGYTSCHPHTRENRLWTSKQILAIDEAIFMMS